MCELASVNSALQVSPKTQHVDQKRALANQGRLMHLMHNLNSEIKAQTARRSGTNISYNPSAASKSWF